MTSFTLIALLVASAAYVILCVIAERFIIPPYARAKAARLLTAVADGDPVAIQRFIALHANTRDLHCMYLLGNLYHSGHGLTHDDEKAVSWYRKAALKGHTCAQANLARCLLKGFGISIDAKQADHWINQAVAANPTDAEAQLFIGLFYAEKPDHPTAIDWLTKSANQGSEDARTLLIAIVCPQITI